MLDPSQLPPPLHVRVRVRVPPLQVWLQELHADHADQLDGAMEVNNGLVF